jgi:hypothetical protein
MRKALLSILIPALLFPSLLFAQTGNTFHANQFPGSTQGQMVSAAQAQCGANTLTCIIVLDPILNAYPTGTMPTQCATCIWQDYRTPAGAPGSAQFTGSVNGLISVADPRCGAVATGCGAGAQVQNTAFACAVGLANAAGTGILIPASPLGYDLNNFVITVPISVVGQGYSLSNPFPTFNSGTTASGSVLCGTQTAGPIFSYKPAGAVGNGVSLSGFYVMGSGTQGTQETISSCTESASLGTCTITGSDTIPADTQVYVTGNSVPQYNGVVTVKSSAPGTFSFYVRSFVTGLGTGTGGNASQGSTCLAIGDSVNLSYPTHFTTDNIGGGNCQVGEALLAQDSRFFNTQLGGNFADGLFGDGNTSYTLNTSQFFGGISIGSHIQFDMAMGGSSLLLTGWDFETPPLSDATAEMVYWDALDSTIGPGNYYEAYNTSLFLGDGIFIPKAAATYNVKVDGGEFSLGSGAIAAIEIAGGGNTRVDLWNGRLSASTATAVLIDSGAYNSDEVTGVSTCSLVVNTGGVLLQASDESGNLCSASSALTFNNLLSVPTHAALGQLGGALSSVNCWLCVQQDTSNDPVLNMRPNAAGTSPMIRQITPTNSGVNYEVDQSGNVTQNSLRPTLLYSAAGTALPTCNSAANGYQYTVSDATSPTFLGAYTSGGAVTSPVICNGTGSYSWKTY